MAGRTAVNATAVALGKAVASILVVGAACFIAGYATGRSGPSHTTLQTAPRIPLSIIEGALAAAATPAVGDAGEIAGSRFAAVASTSDGAPVRARTSMLRAHVLARGIGGGARSKDKADGAPLYEIEQETPPSQVSYVAPKNSLAEETALLNEAQVALRDGDATRALAKLDRLETEHPDGVLREEQQAARVVALCSAHRVEQARFLAARFLAASPNSVHAERVRRACGSGNAP